MGRFWAFLEENGNANEAVIENLRKTNEAKSHTKSQKPSWAGDVRNPTHFLSFSESLGVWLLYENVYDRQVTLCIIVDFTLDLQCQGFVEYSLSSPPEIEQLDVSRRKNLRILNVGTTEEECIKFYLDIH